MFLHLLLRRTCHPLLGWIVAECFVLNVQCHLVHEDQWWDGSYSIERVMVSPPQPRLLGAEIVIRCVPYRVFYPSNYSTRKWRSSSLLAESGYKSTSVFYTLGFSSINIARIRPFLRSDCVYVRLVKAVGGLIVLCQTYWRS